MLPDRVSNPGPLTYESGALPIALRGPAQPVKTQIRLLLVQYDKGLHCLPFRLHLLDRTKQTVKTKIIQLLKQPDQGLHCVQFHLHHNNTHNSAFHL